MKVKSENREQQARISVDLYVTGPKAAATVPFYPFLGEGSPTKIDYRKKLVPLF